MPCILAYTCRCLDRGTFLRQKLPTLPLARNDVAESTGNLHPPCRLDRGLTVVRHCYQLAKVCSNSLAKTPTAA